MGLAFKPDIDDLRESPAKLITKQVIEDNPDVKFMVVEPNISHHDSYELADYATAYEQADTIVFLTAHSVFKTLPYTTDKPILDFCGIFKK